MTKKIAAIVTDLVEDIELSSPKEALEKDGNEVTIISFEADQEITGKKGTKFKSLKTSMLYWFQVDFLPINCGVIRVLSRSLRTS